MLAGDSDMAAAPLAFSEWWLLSMNGRLLGLFVNACHTGAGEKQGLPDGGAARRQLTWVPLKIV